MREYEQVDARALQALVVECISRGVTLSRSKLMNVYIANPPHTMSRARAHMVANEANDLCNAAIAVAKAAAAVADAATRLRDTPTENKE